MLRRVTVVVCVFVCVSVSIFPNSNESAKKTCYNCSIMHQIQLSECSNSSEYHYVAAGILERTCTVPSYIHGKFLLESI